jgi:hypothetical protein
MAQVKVTGASSPEGCSAGAPVSPVAGGGTGTAHAPRIIANTNATLRNGSKRDLRIEVSFSLYTVYQGAVYQDTGYQGTVDRGTANRGTANRDTNGHGMTETCRLYAAAKSLLLGSVLPSSRDPGQKQAPHSNLPAQAHLCLDKSSRPGSV